MPSFGFKLVSGRVCFVSILKQTAALSRKVTEEEHLSAYLRGVMCIKMY